MFFTLYLFINLFFCFWINTFATQENRLYTVYTCIPMRRWYKSKEDKKDFKCCCNNVNNSLKPFTQILFSEKISFVENNKHKPGKTKPTFEAGKKANKIS